MVARPEKGKRAGKAVSNGNAVSMQSQQFRNLPNVNSVLASEALADVAGNYQRELLVDLVREELDLARDGIRRGEDAPAAEMVAEAVSSQLAGMTRQEPRRVINATGVILHTNLGRAPLSPAATQAMLDVAAGYTNLELDLADGRRGSRQARLQTLVRRLTGAEAAFAVNNNASAVLLGLSALASGKEVVVSRAEAVEIGGGFRIPDVCRQSGGELVDIGTTNRTYLRAGKPGPGRTQPVGHWRRESAWRDPGFLGFGLGLHGRDGRPGRSYGKAKAVEPAGGGPG